MNTTQIDKSQDIAKLIEKRDALRTRLKAIQDEYRSGLDSDSEERAVQLENAEVQAGIAKATLEELERIEKIIDSLTV